MKTEIVVVNPTNELVEYGAKAGELNVLQVLSDIFQAKVLYDKASEVLGLKLLLQEGKLLDTTELRDLIACQDAWVKAESLRLARRYETHMKARSRRLAYAAIAKRRLK